MPGNAKLDSLRLAGYSVRGAECSESGAYVTWDLLDNEGKVVGIFHGNGPDAIAFFYALRFPSYAPDPPKLVEELKSYRFEP